MRPRIRRMIELFQFTPLREGRQRSSRQIRRACYFNSRPSARGDSTKSRASSGSTNFNSRPSARGDFCSSGRTWGSAISIHAPPRGATRGVRNSLGDKIFQFTPLREGRPRSCPALPRGEHFNSRPSARGDRAPSPCRPRSKRISIHAPPRGATRQRLPARRRPPHFNSRPSARGDAAFASAEWAKRNFNSRPSARGDAFALLTILGVVVFQFTPLREGRRGTRHKAAFDARFQFTPLREGRRETGYEKSKQLIFQFTPLREGRRMT